MEISSVKIKTMMNRKRTKKAFLKPDFLGVAMVGSGLLISRLNLTKSRYFIANGLLKVQNNFVNGG